MRILHVNNQASVGYLLSSTQRKLGHRSDLLAVDMPRERGPDIPASSVFGLYLKLLRLAPKYDVIHHHGGIGISGIGLWPYRAFGKRVFAHYHGSELRENVQTAFHRLCEVLFISTPDLHRYSRNVGGRELVHIPNPVYVDNVHKVDWDVIIKALHDGAPLRIAHLPSRRGVKGTDNVINSVEKAKREGAGIELDIIENATVEEAMRRLNRAHICIDWMSNDYDIHGVVSVEAMLRGIPTICNIDRSMYPEDIPIIDSNPRGLTDKLLWVYDHRERLPEIGERSREYVLREHHPDVAAGRIEKYL